MGYNAVSLKEVLKMVDVWGWDWSVYEEQLQKMHFEEYHLAPHELDGLRQIKDIYQNENAKNKATMIDHLKYLESLHSKISKILNVQRQHGVSCDELDIKQKKIKGLISTITICLKGAQ